jgi:uncharacterized membrane protein (DUF373 family)
VWHIGCVYRLSARYRWHNSQVKEAPIASKVSVRDWFSVAFDRVEDVIYVGLGLLLAAIAGSLLVAEIIFFAQYLFGGILFENIVMLLDRILLIIIFVEVLYTVQVSFRQRVLQPGPFLVVGLIAATRRILVLTAELPKLVKETAETFQNAMIELALLTVLIVALVVSLRALRPSDPGAAAEQGLPKK